jgi:hypothetical protein
MLLTEEKLERATAGVHLVRAIEDLSQIHDPACAAAIWQRPMASELQTWIDELDPENLPNARVILRPEDVRKIVNEVCDSSGTPECQQRQMLVDDVVRLAGIFVQLMETPYLQLRFDVTKTNACRKFHTDYLMARLVCTYRGSGTQYGTSTEGLDPQTIHSVCTGAPIVMRGQHWPNNPNTNLRHRSPPIEGTGETRLVLVFDPVSELYDEMS